MNLKISYRHLDSSEAVSGKIKEKMNHLNKFFNGKMDVHWVCSVDGHDQHKSEVQVHIDGREFHANAVDSNLYKTLDIVVEKLEKQMRKHSEKIKNKIHRGPTKDTVNFEAQGDY